MSAHNRRLVPMPIKRRARRGKPSAATVAATIAPSSLKAWHCFAFLVVAAIVWYYLKGPLIVIGMLPDSSWA